MWLPDWLYERLPFLYIATGGMCLWFLGTSFAATLSAVVLSIAALLTYIRRRDARRAAAMRVRRRRPRR
jgi:hypothetical protein